MTGVQGMWRYFDRLPVASRDDIVTLGEGDTPLVGLGARLARELGVASVSVKVESLNPTGSFKARIAAVALSLARERHLRGVIGTSSGNGGAAAGAYAAAAGLQSVTFTLTDTLPTKLAEIQAVGGRAIRVHDLGHDARSTSAAAELIAEKAVTHGFYPMLTGFTYAPEAMQGLATIAYELAEQVPDTTVVYAPVGGGGLLTALSKGYDSAAVHDTVRPPRLVGVQPRGSAVLPRALDGYLDGLDGPVTTTVSGLQMAILYDRDGAVQAVRRSGGHACVVTDEDISNAQIRLAHGHGLMAEPAGATAFAGLLHDAAAGRLSGHDRVVVIVSGAAYKDPASFERHLSRQIPVIKANDIGGFLTDEMGS